jgi:hypothetical protein
LGRRCCQTRAHPCAAVARWEQRQQEQGQQIQDQQLLQRGPTSPAGTVPRAGATRAPRAPVAFGAGPRWPLAHRTPGLLSFWALYVQSRGQWSYLSIHTRIEYSTVRSHPLSSIFRSRAHLRPAPSSSPAPSSASIAMSDWHEMSLPVTGEAPVAWQCRGAAPRGAALAAGPYAGRRASWFGSSPRGSMKGTENMESLHGALQGAGRQGPGRRRQRCCAAGPHGGSTLVWQSLTQRQAATTR